MKTHLITEGNNHIFICGMTRSGKTYFATQALSQVKNGVLFFNLQAAATPAKFNKAMADEITLKQILKGLKAGEKIDLQFPAWMQQNMIFSIIEFLTSELLKAGFSEEKPIYLIYDECQLLNLDKDVRNAVRMAATRGLFLGCRCVFVTQRPALADLTFYTQAAEHYIFKLGLGEKEYFKNKGLDFEKCLQLWQENGPHSYIFSDGFNLEGRRAI